jgi:hypothetical protein
LLRRRLAELGENVHAESGNVVVAARGSVWVFGRHGADEREQWRGGRAEFVDLPLTGKLTG